MCPTKCVGALAGAYYKFEYNFDGKFTANSTVVARWRTLYVHQLRSGGVGAEGLSFLLFSSDRQILLNEGKSKRAEPFPQPAAHVYKRKPNYGQPAKPLISVCIEPISGK